MSTLGFFVATASFFEDDVVAIGYGIVTGS
jgi:hypothetical protein